MRVAVGLGVLLLAVFGLWFYLRQAPVEPVPVLPAEDLLAAAAYVGGNDCQSCHAEQAGKWRGSHHDLAMQEVSPATVLGDFEDSSFTGHGVTTRFFRRGAEREEFWVETDGPDGQLAEYRVAYVFGIEPLQQYLLQFPDGHIQALNVCWDTRPAEEGGQRWFHLYREEEERIGFDHPFHWTGRFQNWNKMCADCHSTNVQKGYDPATRSYHTTYSDIDVACEACHGPGSAHVAWAKGDAPSDLADKGLLRRFEPASSWQFDPETGSVKPLALDPSDPELMTCAPCHSRRGLLTQDDRGQHVHDRIRLSLLREGLYFPDGQIRDEVYVFGSFLQSRMYHAGVRCSDCHDPHSTGLRAQGNALCLRCHDAGRFDVPAHHFHPIGSSGAQCVECHMPERHYMIVDPRRDHSIRVPRPDLSERYGTPNVCTGCHQDMDNAEAAAHFISWWGQKKRPELVPAALHAGHRRLPHAARLLASLAVDETRPGITRATALDELGRLAAPQAGAVALALSKADDPLLCFAAAAASEGLDPSQRIAIAGPQLWDAHRVVREEAVRVLAPLRQQLPAKVLDRYLPARAEYLASQRLIADRPEGQLNIGSLLQSEGDYAGAEAAYREAIHLDPQLVQAHVNLADCARARGDEAACEAVLQEARRNLPEHGHVLHALGLSFVRQGDKARALGYLMRAWEVDPGEVQFGFVYAVGLEDAGNRSKAIGVLEQVHRQHPGHVGVLQTLQQWCAAQGDSAAAAAWAAKAAGLGAPPQSRTP